MVDRIRDLPPYLTKQQPVTRDRAPYVFLSCVAHVRLCVCVHAQQHILLMWVAWEVNHATTFASLFFNSTNMSSSMCCGGDQIHNWIYFNLIHICDVIHTWIQLPKWVMITNSKCGTRYFLTNSFNLQNLPSFCLNLVKTMINDKTSLFRKTRTWDSRSFGSTAS